MYTTAKNRQIVSTKGAVSILLGILLVGTSAQAVAQNPTSTPSNSASISEGYTLSADAASSQGRSAQQSKLGNFHHQTQNRPQIWISDIGTLLFDDVDGDGYHSGFSVTIDVDSDFGDTDVYAKIYLEPSNSPAILLHTTERFSVYGSTAGDEYRIDTELRNNYSADNYSVAIDIHDAWSDELLDTANERGFSNLKQLPLESVEMNEFDENNYQYNVEDNQQHDHHQQSDDDDGSADVVVTEYAGLFHPVLLLALAAGLLRRRRKR